MALHQMAFKYGVPDLLRGTGGNGGAVVYNSNTGLYEVPPFAQPTRPWYLRPAAGYIPPSALPPISGGATSPGTASPAPAAPSAPSAPSGTQAPATDGEGGSSPSGVDGGLGNAVSGLGIGGLGNIGGVIGGMLGGPVGSAIGNAIGAALGGDASATGSQGTAIGGPGVDMGTAAGQLGNDAENGIGVGADAGDGTGATGGEAGSDGSDGSAAAGVGVGASGDGEASDGLGFARGGRVRNLAAKYGIHTPRRNFASGGLNDLSPELRGFIEADAASQGIANPVVNFSGAPVGGGYGLQLLDGSTPELAATEEPIVVAESRPSSGRSVDPGLAALFSQYQNKNSYTDDIRKVTAREQAELEALNKLIDQTAQQKEGGPSKAEMYFRLAAAFGTPTKTGNFFESLGNAGTAMAGYEKEKRESTSAAQQRALQLQMEKRKLGLQGARDELTTLRTLAGQDAASQRQMQLELVKDYIASGKPQSEAGKIALDQGLKPNTPEYNKFVQEYVQQKLESGDMYKAIMANVAQQGLALRQDTERRQVEQSKRLTPAELKMREETEDAINAAKSAEDALNEALKINPDTFTKSFGDQVQRGATDIFRPNDPRAVNTRILENLLTGQGLQQLKATFGGAPTEGERAILMDIQGAGSKTVKEREIILKRAIAAVKSRQERDRRKLQEIISGQYRETQPAAPAAPEGEK